MDLGKEKAMESVGKEEVVADDGSKKANNVKVWNRVREGDQAGKEAFER